MNFIYTHDFCKENNALKESQLLLAELQNLTIAENKKKQFRECF